ncbi:hypothetical protein [Occallatibacter savannae]|uniref:hypothetical protein n=1 Tax=Occallatibacter savannae TaxID=1002691 RepID=UPI000D69FDC9|nr:hypothetical protein [Occallatibacter savannae]
MLRIWLVSLAFFTSSTLTSPAQAILDQSFTPPSNYGGFDAAINACCAYVAQTYTAGLTGTLAGVSIPVQSQATFPLHIAIRAVKSGLPTTTVLGDVTLTSSSTQLSDLIRFSQWIPQTAGQQYAIVVNYVGAPEPPLPSEEGSWGGATSSTFSSLYPGGGNFGSVDGVSWQPENGPVFGDLFFKTFVGPPMLPVAINVRPGNCTNKILAGRAIPVAILSSTTFDAPAIIDPASLRFGRTGSEESLIVCDRSQDVNGDRLPDLKCKFDLPRSEFLEGDTAAVLRGSTIDGHLIIGTDSIKLGDERH